MQSKNIAERYSIGKDELKTHANPSRITKLQDVIEYIKQREPTDSRVASSP
jgi:hypothetical protein